MLSTNSATRLPDHLAVSARRPRRARTTSVASAPYQRVSPPRRSAAAVRARACGAPTRGRRRKRWATRPRCAQCASARGVAHGAAVLTLAPCSQCVRELAPLRTRRHLTGAQARVNCAPLSGYGHAARLLQSSSQSCVLTCSQRARTAHVCAVARALASFECARACDRRRPRRALDVLSRRRPGGHRLSRGLGGADEQAFGMNSLAAQSARHVALRSRAQPCQARARVLTHTATRLSQARFAFCASRQDFKGVKGLKGARVARAAVLPVHRSPNSASSLLVLV